MTEPGPAPFPHPASLQRLQTLAVEHRELSIGGFFQQDPGRLEDFSAEAAGWRLDYSRQLLDRQARTALLELAHSAAIEEAREALFDGQTVNSGAIIVRQRGTRIHPGNNVGRGGDDTLYAMIAGTVQYGTKRGRRQVSVLP